MIKRTLIGALTAALFVSSALAQVNVVPQVGTISAFYQKQTYTAVAIGLVAAATPTDIFCIAGSSTKIIKLNKFVVSGTITTAANVPIVTLRRATADTGGTPASTTANPANTISKNDSNNGTASATLIAYTANPTINDSSPVFFGATFLPLAAATGNGNQLILNFNDDLLGLSQPPTLRGAAQQICLNLQSTAATLTGNSLNISLEWTEE